MRPLEIYIHIPFCVKKCKYCDFLSAPSTEAERQRYVKSLCEKIRSYGEIAKAYRVITVFIGGGTPSVLTGEQMERIMEALKSTFAIDDEAEITIEMNPGTVTNKKLQIYKKIGINRLSIGLQSVRNDELKILGRIHSYEDFLETYTMARETGFCNINIDLISAIPGQTKESWRHTLRTVADLKPEHISAYSLIIEEGTPFYDLYGEGENQSGTEKLPDEEEERQMYQDTKIILAEYGFHRYEISNYAQKGYECRHNLGYWNRTEYLGIGDGAASFMNHQRWVQGEIPETLCKQDEMEEYMFLGLRKIEGVSKRKFEMEFSETLENVYGKVIEKMKKQRLLEERGDYIRLTDKGIDVSNYVMSEFLF
ncbi:MAG: radical SAM family heme chaperone HemW [Lachnospiraceae bacterium]